MNLKLIHEDFRGKIESLLGTSYDEIALLTTKAGYARGGCVHKESMEHVVVLEGSIEFHYHVPSETYETLKLMEAGDSITIYPNVPHYYVSTTDSIVIEWGPKMSEKNEKDLIMRTIVEEHNKNV